MTKYIPGRRVTVQEFKKVPPKKTSVGDVLFFIFFLLMIAGLLAQCAG